MRRLVYLGYYLKKLNRDKFGRFFHHVQQQKDWSSTRLMGDVLTSVFRYNVDLLDYFYFRFYDLNDEERSKYAGTGFMYEYQKMMNPSEARSKLADKREFLKHYRPFIRRSFATLVQIERNEEQYRAIQNESGKIVVKNAMGQVGAEVEVWSTEDLSLSSLVNRMKKSGYDLVEEYVIQHPDLMALSPSGLNTVRVFTQWNGENVDWLGARLRVSVNSSVDNLGAGNLAAPVDLETGRVCGKAVYSDITKSDVEVHPITQMPILGFQIPFWQETLALVEAAAQFDPSNRSVGWDVAITSEGPELIEGNHNWCKLLWQLPVKKGLKSKLLAYL